MSPYKRPESAVYYVDVRWRGFPRIRLSTDTTNLRRAADMERTLFALRRAGRRDLIALLAARRLHLAEVHDAYTKDPAALEQLRARADSPRLGDLVPRFLAWMASPAGVSPRTKRRFSPGTIVQYRRSWNGMFATLPQGREATLADLTPGFLRAYRQDRLRATGGSKRITTTERPLAPATINRDLGALGAFLTWCQKVEELTVVRPVMQREREPAGRMRWLSSAELTRFREACPPAWWPFFAALFYTGARFGELRGLRGADILMTAHRLTIHEQHRRVKSREAVRDLPIAPPLEKALAAHLATVGPGPANLVFPGDPQDYGRVRREWQRVCAAAAVTGATIHDARHTFAVHATQAGVPTVRLQYLLGHATPLMTLRYARHAPEAYLDADAAAIAASLGGEHDAEQEARAEAARRNLGIA